MNTLIKLALAGLMLVCASVSAQEMNREYAESLVENWAPEVYLDAGTYIIKGHDDSYGLCFVVYTEGRVAGGACMGLADIAEQYAEFLQAEEFLLNNIPPGEISPDGSRRSAQNDTSTN